MPYTYVSYRLLAIAALKPRVEDGIPYARARVMLTDLSPPGAQPQFEEFVSVHGRRNIGHILGQIKDKYGATGTGLGRWGMMETPPGLDEGPSAPVAPVTPPHGTSCSWSELAMEPLF